MTDSKRIEGTLALSEVLAPFLPRNVNPHDVARRVRIAMADRGFSIQWDGRKPRRMFDRKTSSSAPPDARLATHRAQP